jgi:hypothetical protein
VRDWQWRRVRVNRKKKKKKMRKVRRSSSKIEDL